MIDKDIIEAAEIYAITVAEDNIRNRADQAFPTGHFSRAAIALLLNEWLVAASNNPPAHFTISDPRLTDEICTKFAIRFGLYKGRIECGDEIDNLIAEILRDIGIDLNPQTPPNLEAIHNRYRDTYAKYNFAGTSIDDLWFQRIVPDLLGFIDPEPEDLTSPATQAALIGIADAYIFYLAKRGDTTWICQKLTEHLNKP